MTDSTFSSGFVTHWDAFLEGFEPRQALLLRELDESWRLACSVLDLQEAPGEEARSGGSIKGFPGSREEMARRVLRDPLSRWEGRSPLKRSLLAIEGYHEGVVDTLRRLPPSVQAGAGDVLEGLGTVAPRGSASILVRLRGSQRSLRLQELFQWAVRRLEPRQIEIERRFTRCVERSLHMGVAEWNRARDALDRGASGGGSGPGPQGPDRAAQRGTLDSEARSTLKELAGWLQGFPAALAKKVSWGAAWIGERGGPSESERRARQIERWTGELGSLEEEIHLERTLARIDGDLLAYSDRMADEMESERRDLLSSMDLLRRWLDESLASDGEGMLALSEPRQVVPAASRARAFEEIVRRTLSGLPEEIQLLRHSSNPRRDPRWRTVRPAGVVREAWRSAARDRVDAVARTVETRHLALYRLLERAHQVVEYGSEAEQEAEQGGSAVNREALENARSLVTGDSGVAPPDLTLDRAALHAILADVFLSYRSLLHKGWLGFATRLGEAGLRQGAADLWWRIVRGLRGGIAWSVRSAGRSARWFLLKIQWIPADQDHTVRVAQRPHLPREFTRDPRSGNLPQIYKRLFRLAAVDDPRFLIGREVELQALADARASWEDARPVSVLVTGARGSGKTSLINCALQQPLSGLETVRAEFSERITTRDELRSFLANSLDLASEAQIESHLEGQRRVVVLEEIERTFLRAMGGFEAIRELQRIVASTCKTTFWVVACNQRAFSLLHRAVALGDGFSHRIDSASVSDEILRRAIEVRHNLSGLRLKFRAPTEERSGLRRVLGRFTSRSDPERTFFAVLAAESAGVFRTAFELWLSRIESVRGGTLILNPMVEPDFSAVIGQMDNDDVFTLLALHQHGSLTPEEHARVFQRPLSASRRELDELLSREMIEPDPFRKGMRIRPAAARVAREALHRRNLG